ncbi:DotU family type IV/VI secretion system protein [Bacillus piscicola]|uniref:DotU family type IV/VI secretion system protein n=1 Tax=Bacillus piscicola TaxID=1632684 RepID=UPI001F08C943|nr:DotU family type IV/VI secretion system protein [Bacillus piscicola]
MREDKRPKDQAEQLRRHIHQHSSAVREEQHPDILALPPRSEAHKQKKKKKVKKKPSQIPVAHILLVLFLLLVLTAIIGAFYWFGWI